MARHEEAHPALETTRPDEIDATDYDAIYFTGGRAVMWDFPDAEAP